MNRVIFRCAACKLALSVVVDELEDRCRLSLDDQCDYVPELFYVVADEDFSWAANGHFAINLKDARNTKHHWDNRRLAGCCGLSEPGNTVCVNGHEIGAEFSECYTPRALVFDPTRVELEKYVE